MTTIKVRYSREYDCWYYYAGKHRPGVAVAMENAASLKADAVRMAQRWAKRLHAQGHSVRLAVYKKSGQLQLERFYED